jgi:hypothetical protein
VKTVTYRMLDGSRQTVEYDEMAPCRWCGLPVVEASTSGTACCPWCDLGLCRFDPAHRVDHEPWVGRDADGKLEEPRVHYAAYHTGR